MEDVIHELPSNVPELDPLVSGAQLDAIEGGTAAARGPVAFAGIVDANLDTTFVDPRELVHVMVRPGREYSQVFETLPTVTTGYDVRKNGDGTVSAHYLKDKVYRVSRQTFEANQATLCTPDVYRKIVALQSSPEAKRRARDLEAMRADIQSISRARHGEAAAQREAIERRKAQDMADAYERNQRAQVEAAQAVKQEHAEACEKTTADKLRGMSGAEFETYLMTRRERFTQSIAGMGKIAKARMMEGLDADETEIRQQYQTLHQAVPAKPSDVTAQVEKLRTLRDAGAITQQDYDRQVLALVRG